MENFIYSIPTTVYFGKGKLNSLGSELKKYGSRVLFVYGGGSIKENGCYQDILSQCEAYGIDIYELSGVKSNPDVEMVREGARICKAKKIEIVLAAGGGSVIDCGKMIAAAAQSAEDPWELVMHSEWIISALPVIAVSTAAASGSEMDYTAVISNKAKKKKIACGTKLLLPKAAFIDPLYSVSLGPKETAEGIADILSHLIEVYFTNTKAFLQTRMNEAVFQTCVHCGLVLKDKPDDYEARANLMWAACWAMNGFLRWGMPGGWTCHIIAHELGAAYPELPHGQILAVLLPQWLRIAAGKGKMVWIQEWGRNVWINSGWDHADSDPVISLTSYFREIGLPDQLDLQISNQEIARLSEKIEPQLQNTYVALTQDEISAILRAAVKVQL